MKRLLSASWWLIAILLMALFLVGCERPLQDEVILEATLDADQENLVPDGTLAPFITPSPGAAYPVPAEPGAGVTTPGAGEAETPTEGELPTEPSATEPPAATPFPEEDVIYTVVAGDTLGSIAERYGITVEEIAQANELGNIHTLDVGQQLLIPLGPDEEAAPEATSEPAAEQPPAEEAEEQVHIVQPGDNLYRIGLRYGFTIEALAAYNNLANPDDLEVGQRILIPPEGYTAP